MTFAERCPRHIGNLRVGSPVIVKLRVGYSLSREADDQALLGPETLSAVTFAELCLRLMGWVSSDCQLKG